MKFKLLRVARILFSRLNKDRGLQPAFKSKNYWETRYKENFNSGPGSYGSLADFKAEVINNFVEKYNIQTIIEFGCGDGNQLTLAKYPNYLGLDVSETIVKSCKQKFKRDPKKKFCLIEEYKKKYKNKKSELVLSLDVIFHLIEDDVYESYMKDIFESTTKYVIIYSSNYNENFALHVKCRRFTDWIDLNIKQSFKLLKYIPNKFPYDNKFPETTSFSDFYIYEKLEI